MSIKAILLDLDGTLLDSNDAHAASWIDTFKEFQVEASYDEVRRRIGKGGDKLLPEVSGIDPESELGKKISTRRGEIFQERYFSGLKAFPKSRELLERLNSRGFRLVVATSARKDEMGKLAEIAGATGLLYEATSSSEAENSKPDPDIIQVALGKAGCEASEAIMLGDTPYDISAAAKAGVPTVAVRCGGWGDEDLKGAVAIYDGPAQLLALFSTSPFAEGATHQLEPRRSAK